MTYKTSNTCGKPIASECIEYQGVIPDSSAISDETCPSIEQTTDDLYDRTESLLNNSDLTLLGNDCLTYVEKTTKSVLLKHEEEICALKTLVGALGDKQICNMSITDCGLVFNGLTDECNNPITTLGELLQAIITEITAS